MTAYYQIKKIIYYVKLKIKITEVKNINVRCSPGDFCLSGKF